MLLGPKNGAQRASRHRSVIVAVALAILTLAAANPLSAGAATAPWRSTEDYALYLVNCMRTGGYVRSNGTCAGYGSGRYHSYVAPLKRSGAIAWGAARPWAKSLAVRARCYHGDVGTRLRRAGFRGWTWGENIGCRDGYATARQAVIMSTRRFQAEASYNGGHWKNIRNRNFKCVGIGVWRYHGRTRLVQDFIAPCL